MPAGTGGIVADSFVAQFAAAILAGQSGLMVNPLPLKRRRRNENALYSGLEGGIETITS